MHSDRHKKVGVWQKGCGCCLQRKGWVNQVLLPETLTLPAGRDTGKERLVSAHAQAVVTDLGGWVPDKASTRQVFVTVNRLTN